MNQMRDQNRGQNRGLNSTLKTWNYSTNQSEALQALLGRALAPLSAGASAFVLPEGSTLHLAPSSPADLATLPQAAHLCHQYLRLGDRDLALVNDPGSGGSTLSELTLVAGVRFDPTSAASETDLLIVHRIALTPRWSGRSHLDDEGVRIPPTPIGSRGQLNRDLLLAITAHPLAPPHLVESIDAAWENISRVIEILKSHGRDPNSELRKANFKRYLADSSRAFELHLGRLPLGNVTVTQRLQPNGELLKLKLEISESRVHFDFGGTEASTMIGLTELATFGACMSAILSALNLPVPLNSGVFDHFQASTPAKTLLSAKAPQGAFRGMQAGLPAVCDLVSTAVTRMNSRLAVAAGAGSDGRYEIAFEDGRRISGRIAPGAPAQIDRAGLDGFARWSARAPYDPSLESNERTAPVTYTAAGLRAGSGGAGKHKGGDGQLLAMSVQEAATFSWMFGPLASRHDGASSGRAGSAAEIEIIRANGKKEELQGVEGTIKLAVGDEVRLYASGGGGYGEPEA